MDGWNTIVSFWDDLFSGAMLVSGSVGYKKIGKCKFFSECLKNSTQKLPLETRPASLCKIFYIVCSNSLENQSHLSAATKICKASISSQGNSSNKPREYSLLTQKVTLFGMTLLMVHNSGELGWGKGSWNPIIYDGFIYIQTLGLNSPAFI